MSDQRMLDLTGALERQRCDYAANLRKTLERLRHLAGILPGGEDTAGTHAALRELAHRLKGSGATFGFTAISSSAADLEAALDARSEGTPGALQALIAACESVVSGLAPAVTPAATPAPQNELSELAPSASVLPRVVVVEDDENISSLLVKLLQGEAETRVVADPEKVIELLLREVPDLVLMDENLGGPLSGTAIMEQMQHHAPLAGIPVVMVTAEDDPEAVMRALMVGAVDYLIKPLQISQVHENLRTRLRRLRQLVLVADDDAAVRDLLAYKFHHAGYRTLLARDGFEALEKLQGQSPALAILDRMMPGMDGLALLRTLREQNSGIPVVFLTARQASADVLEGLNTGAADYITKPFNPDEVLTRCVRILQSREEAPA